MEPGFPQSFKKALSGQDMEGAAIEWRHCVSDIQEKWICLIFGFIKKHPIGIIYY